MWPKRSKIEFYYQVSQYFCHPLYFKFPMCGFIAQVVEHRTSIAEVTGSNPVEALIFFRPLLSNCLNWKIYCDDHSSLSSTTAVQIWIISYKLHTKKSFFPFLQPRSESQSQYIDNDFTLCPWLLSLSRERSRHSSPECMAWCMSLALCSSMKYPYSPPPKKGL